MRTTKTTLLSVLFFISTNLFSQSWTWQNPTPNANTIISSYFFNESTGFFAGEFGNLLKTTNGGANITVQNTGNNFNFNAITFINATTGYIGGGINDKIIMKTTNGGSNWVTSNLGTPYTIKDIKFINANNGLAITDYQTIHYTSNGGTNWISLNGAASVLYSIEYVSPTLVYISSSGGILQKSTNGGLNWTSQLIASASYSLYDVQFLDSLTGYVGGDNGTIVKTTNGGANWISVNSPVTSTVYSISFINATTGVAACENGRFIKTTNGGTNWVLQIPPPTNYNRLSTVKYFPSGVIYTSGVYGNNMKSTDAGATWTSLVSGINSYIFSSYFLNANTGFASMTAGYILKTTNGGTNWTEYLTPTSVSNITGLQFIDANTGFAIAAFTNDVLLKTTDAGNNWFSLNIGNNGYAGYVQFLNANTGIVQTYNKTLRTTNGGNNWTLIDTVLYSQNGLQFVNALTGYSINYNSPNTTFRKTTNGGLNWTLLPGIVPNVFTATFKFSNVNTGYATGGGNMFKTTDGGNTWVLFSSIGGSSEVLYLLDSNSLLVGGTYGQLRKSTDGGLSYTVVPFVSINGITTMSFINSMTGWIMGQGGMIVKTNDILTNNGEIISQTPNSFNLYQNYPNPFNPNTVIRYQLSVVSKITLKVYDILGKEVAILVNEVKNAGNYSVDFNASNFPSGVYFYKLEANDHSEVKKMLLLK
jgi:photosystem II stability/assembly factor-like uncharacterized protein